MRELGPFLAGITDTQFKKGLDGKATALRLPTARLTTIKSQVSLNRTNVKAACGQGKSTHVKIML